MLELAQAIHEWIAYKYPNSRLSASIDENNEYRWIHTIISSIGCEIYYNSDSMRVDLTFFKRISRTEHEITHHSYDILYEDPKMFDILEKTLEELKDIKKNSSYES